MSEAHAVHAILANCTQPFRKGALVTQHQGGPLEVIEFNGSPPISAACPELTRVDCHFIVVGVDKAKAEAHRAELVAWLKEHGAAFDLDKGPSYIATGAYIGDQGAAFQLYALGEVLGLWKVMTPARIGFSPERADEVAGLGYIMITPPNFEGEVQ